MPAKTSQITAIYEEGVRAIESFGRDAGGYGVWEHLACGTWTAAETSRHVLSVANWYHGWLDRAIGGEVSPPFPYAELDSRNAEDLVSLQDWSGLDALAAFGDRAMEYHARAVDHWEQPFGYPFGIVTVGHHYAVAAAEWHLHAWDLLRLVGVVHQPSEPKALLEAVGACVATAEGGVRGALLARAVPIASRITPWRTMLRKSGRS